MSQFFEPSDPLMQERIELSYHFTLDDNDIYFSDEEIFQSDEEIYESDDDDDDIDEEYFNNLHQAYILSYHQHQQQSQQTYQHPHHSEIDINSDEDETFILLSEKTENILTI